MIHVLDACAMIAYLQDEPGADVVDALLASDRETCAAHATNLCEVYYDVVRRSGAAAAEAAMHALFAAGIKEHDDLDGEFWRAAAAMKARSRASLADCFCATLAERLSGQVVTSDRREFGPLAARGECRVRFIR